MAGLAATALPLSGVAFGTLRSRGIKSSVKLGVASYSLRNFSRADAIAGLQEIGSLYVSVKSMHLPYESTPDEISMARREFNASEIQIVGGGVIYLKDDSDDAMRPLFDYAKAAGFPMMVIGPTRESLPRVERFVQEYNIPVAIHNHGPDDEEFPAPSDALKAIGDMDQRIGVCVDLGHTARTGNNVVEEIAAAGPRLFDIHMKDLAVLSEGSSQCVVGEGAMPVPSIFRQLIKMEYPGYVNLEFEINADNPVPGMSQSFAYMRGVLDGLS